MERTRQLLEHTENLLSTVKDAETGQRGFLLTGDDQYLAPYNAAVTAAPYGIESTAHAEQRPADRPAQDRRARWRWSRSSSQQLNDVIMLRRSQGFQAALEVIRTNRGKNTMDDIRRLGGEIENEVYSNLTGQSNHWQQEGQRTQLTMALGAGILVLLSPAGDLRYRQSDGGARPSDHRTEARQRPHGRQPRLAPNHSVEHWRRRDCDGFSS